MNTFRMRDKILVGHAAQVMADWPASSIDCVITSPPYWTAVSYSGQEYTWPSYEDYLSDMQSVFAQCERALRPNGKLCIVAPIMPIPQAIIRQDTRHLKNIAFDIEHKILTETILQRYSSSGESRRASRCLDRILILEICWRTTHPSSSTST
jgi:DNA modification methylase